MGHDYFGVFFFSIQKNARKKSRKRKAIKRGKTKKKSNQFYVWLADGKRQNHYSRREYTLSNFAANLGRDVGDQPAGVGPELDAGQTEPVKLEKVTGVGVLKDWGYGFEIEGELEGRNTQNKIKVGSFWAGFWRVLVPGGVTDDGSVASLPR